jgi:hypothetical protein
MIEIHIISVNNPIFIELQYLTLNKFCKDEFKIVIFNDAKDWPDYTNFNNTKIKGEIKNLCEKLGVEHHFVPNENHIHNPSPSWRHTQTINYIYQNFQKDNTNLIFTLDCDMFPIKEFSFEKWENFDIVSVFQYRENISYLWPNLYFINPNTLPNKDTLNWDGGLIERVSTDTGGKSYYYLRDNKNLKVGVIPHLSSESWNKKDLNFELDENVIKFLDKDIRNKGDKYFCEIYDEIFLHYRAGSNWEELQRPIHQIRTINLKKCLEEICKQKIEN